MTRFRMILNTFFSGPQAWFFVAADRGYFAEAGVEVVFTEGDTLANAVPKVASGAFDIGYGDMNAVIEHAARDPDTAPVAIMVLHAAPPYTVAVGADGPVRAPGDLVARTLLSHPGDAALRMFGEFAHRTGINVADVGVRLSEAPHTALVRDVLDGQAAGLFGFVNTLRAAAHEAGIAPERLRHLEWRTYVPELYGAAVITRRDVLRRHRDALRGFVAAVNRGVRDVAADPVAGIDAVARRNPALDRAANLARLRGTLAGEMRHAEVDAHGIGDADDQRLAAAAALIAATKGLLAVPAPAQVFDRSLLPPPAARARLVA